MAQLVIGLVAKLDGFSPIFKKPTIERELLFHAVAIHTHTNKQMGFRKQKTKNPKNRRPFTAP